MGERLGRVLLRTRDLRADALALVTGLTVATLAAGVIVVSRAAVVMVGVLVGVAPSVMMVVAVLVRLGPVGVRAVVVVVGDLDDRLRVRPLGMAGAPTHLPTGEPPEEDRKGQKPICDLLPAVLARARREHGSYRS